MIDKKLKGVDLRKINLELNIYLNINITITL